MKRLLAFLLSVLLLCSLCGCGQTPVSSVSESEDSETSESLSESDTSSQPEDNAPAPSNTLLSDADFAAPPQAFWMLKIANSMSQMHPENKFKDYVETLRSYGYAGVVSNVAWNKYLTSDKLWAVFEDQVRWANETGARFWIYDEKGYPSGAAGTLVLDANPEYETMGIARVKESVSGGERVELTQIPQSHKALFAVAYPGTGDNSKDLSGAVDISEYITPENGLVWTAPEGEWVAELFLQKPLYEETHASSNVFSDRRYVNIMDKDALASFISLTYDEYYKRVGEYFGTTVEAFFTDEPSLMSFNTPDYEGTTVEHPLDKDFVRYPTVAWSRTFFEEFQTRMGYDITPYMTLLFGGDSDLARQVRYDYWTVAAALIEEAFFAQIGDWCDAHNVAFSGHVLCEENLHSVMMTTGNMMRNYKHQGIVGIDLLTSAPDDLFWHCVTVKTAASANRLYNKGGVMSEDSLFSDTGKGLTLDQVRSGFAVQYALGVTQMTSYYGYNEIAKEGCPREDRDDTGMMLARMGYALSEGEHISDAALYYPIESGYAEYLPNTVDWGNGLSMEMQNVSEGFGSALRMLLSYQYDTDILGADNILAAKLEDGMLVSEGGERFRVLVVPYVTMMQTAVLEKLADFAEQGLPIVLLNGSKTPLVPMNEDADYACSLWDQLTSADTTAVLNTDAGLPNQLETMYGTRDLVLSAKADMLYNHMSREDGDIYLLSLYSNKSFDGTATFRAQGSVRLLDPLTGEAVPGESVDNGDGTTTVSLSLPAYGYVIVEFTK